MRTLLLAFTLLVSATLFAQRATVDNDTATYVGKKYVVGDTITLGYGSEASKRFAFVRVGSLMTGIQGAEAKYSKTVARIDKVYKQQGKCYIRAKMLDTNMIGNKIFIDIEGAVDNKEL